MATSTAARDLDQLALPLSSRATTTPAPPPRPAVLRAYLDSLGTEHSRRTMLGALRAAAAFWGAPGSAEVAWDGLTYDRVLA